MAFTPSNGLHPLELGSLSHALIASFLFDARASSLASAADIPLPLSSLRISIINSEETPPPLPLSGSDTSSAWWSKGGDDAEVRAERLRLAVEKLGPSKTPFWRAKIVEHAAKSWDKFYSAHGSDFFHDRGWLERDFPILRHASYKRLNLLEFGCGTGASFLPLLERLPHLFVTAFDFSARAVTLALAHNTYISNSHRACAFVGDGAAVSGVAAAVAEAHQTATLTTTLQSPPPHNGFDAVLMLYMLSAMPTETHVRIFQNAVDCLRPGGLLLLRDYGEADEAQTRFGKGAKFNDSGSVMVRRDGTLAAFLRIEDMSRAAASVGLEETGLDYIVAPSNNFVKDDDLQGGERESTPAAPSSGINYLLRTYSNRATGEMLQRVWVHGVWRKPT
jgi:SAM-dependent methyltransferase